MYDSASGTDMRRGRIMSIYGAWRNRNEAAARAFSDEDVAVLPLFTAPADARRGISAPACNHRPRRPARGGMISALLYARLAPHMCIGNVAGL